MTNILNLDLGELTAVISGYGEKSFRAKQIFGWLARGAASFDEMNNVPKPLREKLAADYYIGLPQAVDVQRSREDGTVKCLFEFADGERIESVLMRYEYGNTICISSQAGCRMGCRFCASTRDGLTRSLTAGEMYGQVLAMKNIIAEKDTAARTAKKTNTTDADIRHIVIMGMGEPFDNYDNVAAFLRLINCDAGYGLGMRNITVSTCGIVPRVRQFAADFPQVNLAISLHAATDEKRREIMPIANLYSLDELLTACAQYADETGRRVTFEYALISGINDDERSARELSELLTKYMPLSLVHVNLIPLNSVEGSEAKTSGTVIDKLSHGIPGNALGQKASMLKGSDRKRAAAFRDSLQKRGITATVRRSLGADIDGACGQLRAKRIRP